MLQNDKLQGSRRNNRVLRVGVLCIASVVLAWTQWRAYASMRDIHQTSIDQLALMQADAAQILVLRNAPQVAVGQTRTSQELLHQVEKALAKAGIDRSLWSDSVPQAAMRMTGTDYQRTGVRLYFGGVTLQQLSAFAFHLHAEDPTLGVSAVNLVNRDQESPNFDVDLLVSYLVFSPQNKKENLGSSDSSRLKYIDRWVSRKSRLGSCSSAFGLRCRMAVFFKS